MFTKTRRLVEASIVVVCLCVGYGKGAKRERLLTIYCDFPDEMFAGA